MGEEQTTSERRVMAVLGKPVDWLTGLKRNERGTVVMGSWPEGTLEEQCKIPSAVHPSGVRSHPSLSVHLRSREVQPVDGKWGNPAPSFVGRMMQKS